MSDDSQLSLIKSRFLDAMNRRARRAYFAEPDPTLADKVKVEENGRYFRVFYKSERHWKDVCFDIAPEDLQKMAAQSFCPRVVQVAAAALLENVYALPDPPPDVPPEPLPPLRER